MKKHYKVFFAGIGLIIIGFIMDGVINYVPFSTNAQLNDVKIEPKSEYFFQINSRGEHQISGVFSGSPSDVPFDMKVLSPDNTVLWEGKSKFDPPNEQYLLPRFENPYSKGSLDVIISNLGERSVTVKGGMHDVVGTDEYDNEIEAVIDIYFEFLVYSIISNLLKLAGIIVAIIGAVILYKDKKISIKE